MNIAIDSNTIAHVELESKNGIDNIYLMLSIYTDKQSIITIQSTDGYLTELTLPVSIAKDLWNCFIGQTYSDFYLDRYFNFDSISIKE